MGPTSETFSYSSDPGSNLRLNGATQEEIEFLRGETDWRSYRGRRVELNAFTSDAFVEWLESKLKEQGVVKVIPNDATLESAYRRALSIQQYREAIDEATQEIQDRVAAVEIPKTLRADLEERIKSHPSQPWDEALERILPSSEDLAESQNEGARKPS